MVVITVPGKVELALPFRSSSVTVAACTSVGAVTKVRSAIAVVDNRRSGMFTIRPHKLEPRTSFKSKAEKWPIRGNIRANQRQIIGKSKTGNVQGL